MLTIRQSQMHIFREQQREQFIIAMRDFLHAHFQEELRGIKPEGLHENIAKTLDRAASYGLHTHRDCCRFLNLAVTLGWDFEQLPQNAWMQQRLTDPNGGDASQRLQNVVSQYIYRMETAQENLRLRNEFGPPQSDRSIP